MYKHFDHIGWEISKKANIFEPKSLTCTKQHISTNICVQTFDSSAYPFYFLKIICVYWRQFSLNLNKIIN